MAHGRIIVRDKILEYCLKPIVQVGRDYLPWKSALEAFDLNMNTISWIYNSARWIFNAKEELIVHTELSVVGAKNMLTVSPVER